MPIYIFLCKKNIKFKILIFNSALEYMRVFHKGTKAFDYFLGKDFRYSLKNALRIMTLMHESDKKRYNFDASTCDWSEFIDRCLIGLRRFYFKESAETTDWHRMYWKVLVYNL